MTNSQLTDLRTLILSEVGDFFAGVGSPGEPETPEEMQRELSMRLGRILNNHIVNYPRCEVLVEILRECRAARDEAQAELQERRKADSEPVAVVPDDVSGPLAHAYKELTPTFMRNHIAVFERYGIAPNDSSTVIQALRIALDGIERRAAMLQAEPVTTANKLGNSPVIGIDPASVPDRTVEVRYVAPPGFVLVPKEPTEEMNKAGWAAMNEHDAINPTYRAMLAAAPHDTPALNSVQSGVTVSDTWIPVSERLPEEGGRYWCYVEEQNSLGKSHYQWNCSWNGEIWGGAMMYGRVTHWMPLPAAPQEVK